MKNLLLAAIFLVGITLWTCKKPKVNNTPVNADLKAAFNYKIGTYWIYKDSISGDVDSFFVTGNTPSTNVNSGAGYSLDAIQIFISEYNINPVLANSIYNWQFLYQSAMFDIVLMNSKNNHKMFLSPLINYPFSDSFNACSSCDLNNTDSFSKVLSISSSYSIGGNIFSNVAVVNHIAAHTNASPNLYSYYSDLFFICPSAGIIKMRLNHPDDSLYRVWEIQKWNIVK